LLDGALLRDLGGAGRSLLQEDTGGERLLGA
jgi:hypothetical protein